MSSYLSREAILGFKPKTQSVDAFGGQALIRQLDADEVIELNAKIGTRPAADANILWVLASIVDESGTRLFVDGDFDVIKKRPFAELLRVTKAALALNGINEQELAKNLQASQNGDSATD